MTKPPNEPPRLRSVLHAARYLGISRNTCWALIRAGDLPCVRIARRVLLDRVDLDDFIERRRSGGTR